MCDFVGRVQTLLGMLLCIIVALVATFPVTTRAQGAREYLNTPVESWSGSVDFVFSKAQSAASAQLPVPNDLTVSRLTVPFLLYSFSQRKRYGGISLSTPFTRVKDADGVERTSGFTDPGVGLHLNIFGLPALKRDEIATAIPQTFMTARFTVNVPLGSYDRNRPVNPGAHRWAFTPMINLDITRDKGVSWFDLYAQGKFFTDNHQFRGNQKLSQKPLLILTGYYSHNIGSGTKYWASIGTSFDHGGETSINGVEQNNTANGFRPGVGVSGRFGRFRITVRYENTATKEAEHHRNGSVIIRVASLLF